jgi:hypothetical protein
MCLRRYRYATSATRLTACAKNVASAEPAMPRPGNGSEPEDEKRIQRDIKPDRQHQEVKRRLRIPGAAQHRHDEGIHVHEGQREEDHAHIGGRERYSICRRAHRGEQALAQGTSRRPTWRSTPARRTLRSCRPRVSPRADCRRRCAGRPVWLPPSTGQIRRPGAETSRYWRWRSQRARLRPEIAHPDGVHRAIHGLQDIAAQRSAARTTAERG